MRRSTNGPGRAAAAGRRAQAAHAERADLRAVACWVAAAAAGLVSVGPGCGRAPAPADADEARADPGAGTPASAAPAEPGRSSAGADPDAASGVAPLPPEPVRLDAPLGRVIDEARRGGGTGILAPVTAEERAAFEAALQALAAAAPRLTSPGGAPGEPARGALASALPAPALAVLERLGFELGLLVEEGALLIVVREAPGMRRGGGIYALRAGERATASAAPGVGPDAEPPSEPAAAPAAAPTAEAASAPPGPTPAAPTPALPATRELIVQVPHSFFDEGTLPIALAWFQATRARALFVNTVHRYEGKAPREQSRADVCHEEGTYFQAATRALSGAFDGAVFVQVHGYRGANHPDLGPAQAVLSPGSRAGLPEPSLERARVALEAVLGPGKAVCYDGRAVRSLGGTRNLQGAFLNGFSDDLFFHLELEGALRQRLRDEEALRARMAEALAPLWEP